MAFNVAHLLLTITKGVQAMSIGNLVSIWQSVLLCQMHPDRAFFVFMCAHYLGSLRDSGAETWLLIESVCRCQAVLKVRWHI